MNKARNLLYVFMSLLLLVSCSHLSNQSQGWADRTLKKLSLREKIAQMMIYRMQMRFKDISPVKWNEIMMQISSDGIGGVHLWYGDASSSLTLMNEMQKASKIPILFDADIEYGLNQRFPSGTDLLPLMAIAATGNPKNAFDVGKIIAEQCAKTLKPHLLELGGKDPMIVLKDANLAIINALKEEGALLKEEKYSHRYPYDWRTKKPTIFRATEQWFASVEGFRKEALKAIDQVKWMP